MKNVLIVERREYTAQKLAEYLTALGSAAGGVQVHAVRTGQQGLVSLQGAPPDLILLSDLLTDMQPGEFLKRKKRAGAEPVPVILVGQVKNREALDALGYPAVYRPVNLDHLRKILVTGSLLPVPDRRSLNSEVFIRDDIIVVELSGRLGHAELVSLTFRILDTAGSHQSVRKRFFIIIYRLETQGMTQVLFERLFDFVARLPGTPSEYVKVLSADPEVRAMLRSSQALSRFEVVDSYVDGLRKLKSLFLKDGEESVRVGFLHPDVTLYKDVYDSRGRLVKRKGTSFTQKELEVLRRRNIDRLFYYRTARVDDKQQIVPGEDVDVVLDAIQVTGVMVPEELKQGWGEEDSKKRLALNLLIVNSDPVELDKLRDFFVSRGFPIRAAAACSEARELFSLMRFDYCVVDLELSDGGGLDLVQELQDAPGKKPRFVITGRAVSAEEVKRAVRLGVKGFLKSPVDLDKLSAVFS
jgi:DNA-binding response OmpR family regulator